MKKDTAPPNSSAAQELEKALSDFPELAQAYEDHASGRRVRYDDDAYDAFMAYQAVNEVLWPYLEKLLSNDGPDAALRTAFQFIERLAGASDFARGVVATELGWELWARRHNRPSAELNSVAERYMGPKTAYLFASQEALFKRIQDSRWSSRISRWLRARTRGLMPDGGTRLDADLRRAYRDLTDAKFPRIQPREWTVLDDVQIDLDLDGGDLAGMAERWISSHRLGYPDIPLDETIDERLAEASSEDAEAKGTLERFRSYRLLQLGVARCLSLASGRPVRYWRR